MKNQFLSIIVLGFILVLHFVSPLAVQAQSETASGHNNAQKLVVLVIDNTTDERIFATHLEGANQLIQNIVQDLTPDIDRLVVYTMASRNDEILKPKATLITAENRIRMGQNLMGFRENLKAVKAIPGATEMFRTIEQIGRWQSQVTHLIFLGNLVQKGRSIDFSQCEKTQQRGTNVTVNNLEYVQKNIPNLGTFLPGRYRQLKKVIFVPLNTNPMYVGGCIGTATPLFDAMQQYWEGFFSTETTEVQHFLSPEEARL